MESLEIDKNSFYTSKANYTEYMYCWQYAKWNVEKISKSNNANGYIVQMVKMKIENDNDVIIKQYFEAWKVENGKCCEVIDNSQYNDLFLIGRDIYDSFHELKMSIGKSGQSCFEGVVFWIDKCDELYKDIDKWEKSEVEEAKELKSKKYSEKLENQFRKRRYFNRKPFVHKWDMTKEDDIFRITCKYLYEMCDNYSDKLKKMKLENYIIDLFSEEHYNIKQKVVEKMKKQLQIDDI